MSIAVFYQELVVSIPDDVEVMLKPYSDETWLFIFEKQIKGKVYRVAEYLREPWIRENDAKSHLLQLSKGSFERLEAML